MSERRCEPKVPTPTGTLHLIQDWRNHPIAAIWRGGEYAEWVTYDFNGAMTLRRGNMVARAGYRYIAPVPQPAEIEALRRVEKHAGLLRDGIESAARDAGNAETVRAKLRLLVRAFDEGAA